MSYYFFLYSIFHYFYQFIPALMVFFFHNCVQGYFIAVILIQVIHIDGLRNYLFNAFNAIHFFYIYFIQQFFTFLIQSPAANNYSFLIQGKFDAWIDINTYIGICSYVFLIEAEEKIAAENQKHKACSIDISISSKNKPSFQNIHVIKAYLHALVHPFKSFNIAKCAIFSH
ncbi:hypothetical protein SDC9_179804 [bioreactor metagenome]|uniref:Transmembrane protein n=1 Tax=bioreactor metagenome TaxID=1076179 RepID=A0A645H1G4_9ZZZZ